MTKIVTRGALSGAEEGNKKRPPLPSRPFLTQLAKLRGLLLGVAGRAGHQVDFWIFGALARVLLVVAFAAAMSCALNRGDADNRGGFAFKADAASVLVMASVAFLLLGHAFFVRLLLAVYSPAMMADAAVLQAVLVLAVRKISRIHGFVGAIGNDQMPRPLILLLSNDKTCAKQQRQSCAQNDSFLHEKITVKFV